MSELQTTRQSLTLPSTLASVEAIEQAVHHWAVQAGFDEETIANLAMIAREAAANAVVHGNRYAADKHVQATFALSSAALTCTIIDQGEGLDPQQIPDPLAPENLLRTSGRGIFLMRAFADEVLFERRPHGMQITLIKHRDMSRSAPLNHPIDIQNREENTMSLKIKSRAVDGVTILDLNGRVTLGDGSVVLRDAVKEALSKGNKNILLNLGDVDYIDSSGIGELVSAFTSAKNAGGEVKLLNLTKKVHDLLQITKLYTVFDVQEDEAKAITTFTK